MTIRSIFERAVHWFKAVVLLHIWPVFALLVVINLIILPVLTFAAATSPDGGSALFYALFCDVSLYILAKSSIELYRILTTDVPRI